MLSTNVLSTFSWLPPKRGYVIVIENPEKVLAGEIHKLPLLVRVLTDAGNTWHEAIEDGEEWDRVPVPFHVVLFAKSRHSPTVVANWNAAGAGIGLP